jgi:hypothetical protein
MMVEELLPGDGEDALITEHFAGVIKKRLALIQQRLGCAISSCVVLFEPFKRCTVRKPSWMLSRVRPTTSDARSPCH